MKIYHYSFVFIISPNALPGVRRFAVMTYGSRYQGSIPIHGLIFPCWKDKKQQNESKIKKYLYSVKNLIF